MKTLGKLTIFIILVSMVLCSACTKECDDKFTLDKYNVELKTETDAQEVLANQFANETDNNKKAQLMGQINTSLAKESQIRAKIEALKNSSKCL